jgi:hypothetical protein
MYVMYVIMVIVGHVELLETWPPFWPDAPWVKCLVSFNHFGQMAAAHGQIRSHTTVFTCFGHLQAPKGVPYCHHEYYAI